MVTHANSEFKNLKSKPQLAFIEVDACGLVFMRSSRAVNIVNEVSLDGWTGTLRKPQASIVRLLDRLQKWKSVRRAKMLRYAFTTEASAYGSISSINIDTEVTIRHHFDITFTKLDPYFNSMYNGEVIRNRVGTTSSYLNSEINDIALTGGTTYWGGNASIPITGAVIQNPANFPVEQAGFTVNDGGRTLARSGKIQAANTMAILDGWLYLTTNPQELALGRQYNNVDKRQGPFKSYHIWIGRGPAV
ncbi:hypothetical protein SBOR_1771 [Sclerotinia borealis F-4128]|uniref:Uncharacterized protein n=1 Tax=Sclerotinia borealis (strain F-4128) TaxID=1432307 RepID=W9CTT4_SCLBF|nr:hypothetical protein SBOR_1771 [Sclerotinia borealis F-4128]